MPPRLLVSDKKKGWVINPSLVAESKNSFSQPPKLLRLRLRNRVKIVKIYGSKKIEKMSMTSKR